MRAVAPGRPGRVRRICHEFSLGCRYTLCGVFIEPTWVLAPDDARLMDGRGAVLPPCPSCERHAER